MESVHAKCESNENRKPHAWSKFIVPKKYYVEEAVMVKKIFESMAT